MDRRRSALALLAVFVVLTAASIVVSGSRPALGQGAAPAALQFAGYACALLAGVLLSARPAAGGDRQTGGVVLGAVGVLVVVEVLTTAADDGGGANIGAGLVRLVCLVVIAVTAVRLAATVLTRRRS